MITKRLSLLVSDQKTSLAGGKPRKYTKQTVRQMDGWLGREFELHESSEKVEGWVDVIVTCISAWTCFCGQGMLSELDMLQ